MTISIALCTFNGARFIADQLASFEAQDLRPDELIICDDGSTDATREITQAFASHASFPVRFNANERQLGVAANFSRAISLCSGDLIALSDQDDVWDPRKLRRVKDTFENRPDASLVFSDAEAIDDSGQTLGYRLWDAVLFTTTEREATQRGQLLDVLLRHQVVTGATLAFRAQFREVLLPIPGHCLHDQWIAVLLSALGTGVAISEPLIGYRQHATQTSGGERPLNFLDQARLARAQTAAVLRDRAAQFQAARDRLASQRVQQVDDTTLFRLSEKIDHMLVRSRTKECTMRRLPLVTRELLTGRYFRYSYGWRAVLADLLL